MFSEDSEQHSASEREFYRDNKDDPHHLEHELLEMHKVFHVASDDEDRTEEQEA